MNNTGGSLDQGLNAFAEQLLRWNRQINLVSRQATEDRLEGLFKQCLGGAETVQEWFTRRGEDLGSDSDIWYFDLGSGGGLPGVIWHLFFFRLCGGVRSFMVEPRDKRAWFLDRISKLTEIPPFESLCGRWGEVEVSDSGENCAKSAAPVVIISLKALNLSDTEVISGLESAFLPLRGRFSEFSLVIARYYPPDQVFDESLVAKLELPPRDQVLEKDDYIYRGSGAEVLPLGPSGRGGASLVFSPYQVTSNI